MSNDDGGFDMVIELAQSLVSAALVAMKLPTPPPLPIAFAGAQGNLNLAPTIDGATIGGGTLSVGNVIDISIDLEGSTIAFTSVPAPLNSVPPDLDSINLNGDVVVPVPWTASVAGVMMNLGGVQTAAVSQDVDNSILAAPLVQFLLAQTLLQDPSGALYQATVTQIKDTIQQTILQVFQSPSLQGNGEVVSFQQLSAGITKATGKPLAAVTGATPFPRQTIALGLTIGGAGGSFSPPWHSDLLRGGAGVPVDSADLVVSNACFLRDFLEHVLSSRLGLSAAGFQTSEPFAWFGNATLPGSSGALGGAISNAVITSAVGFVSSAGITIVLGVTINGVGGTFTITTNVTLTFAVAVTSAAGSLTFTLKLSGSPTLSGTNDSIAWWVYLAGFAIGGLDLDMLLAAVQAAGPTVASGIVSGLAGGLLTFPPIPFPLPTGLPPLNVRATNLSQSDAPPTGITLVGFPPISLPIPQNDIVVNLV